MPARGESNIVPFDFSNDNRRQLRLCMQRAGGVGRTMTYIAVNPASKSPVKTPNKSLLDCDTTGRLEVTGGAGTRDCVLLSDLAAEYLVWT